MTEQNKQGGKVSIRAYATMIGVDEKTVRKARDAGLLLDGWDPVSEKIIPDLADAAWGNVLKVVRPKAGVSREMASKKLFDDFEKGAAAATSEAEKEWLQEEEIRTGGLLGAISVTSSMSLQDAVKKREIIALALDKKKLEEAEGILIRRDVVEKALFLLGSELKKALLDIPARCVADIMACTNEIEAMNILSQELTQVLSTYGNLKENSLSGDSKR